jgi:hypothetical protein
VKCSRFFQVALFIPLIMAAIGYLVRSMEFFVFSFAVGGIPYIPVAVLLSWRAGRARSLRGPIWLSVLAPFLYAVAFATFLMVIANVPEAHLSLAEYMQQWMQGAELGASFGALYVLFAWLLWSLGSKLQWIRNEFAT